MPLESGSSKEVISRNIAAERRAGKSEDQAVAIAMRKAGKSRTDSLRVAADAVAALTNRFDAMARRADMVLTQEFKSSEGALKRAAFENAHSKTHKFNVVRFYEGKLDEGQFDANRFKEYTWRLEKTKR